MPSLKTSNELAKATVIPMSYVEKNVGVVYRLVPSLADAVSGGKSKHSLCNVPYDSLEMWRRSGNVILDPSPAPSSLSNSTKGSKSKMPANPWWPSQSKIRCFQRVYNRGKIDQPKGRPPSSIKVDCFMIHPSWHLRFFPE